MKSSNKFLYAATETWKIMLTEVFSISIIFWQFTDLML